MLPQSEDPVGDVWILDTSCKGVLARWHEIFPADPLALMQHSGVHLGGGLVAMVAGELHERPAAPWVLSHTWSIEAEGDVIDMHITNALSLMDTQECAAAAGHLMPHPLIFPPLSLEPPPPPLPQWHILPSFFSPLPRPRPWC